MRLNRRLTATRREAEKRRLYTCNLKYVEQEQTYESVSKSG